MQCILKISPILIFMNASSASTPLTIHMNAESFFISFAEIVIIKIDYQELKVINLISVVFVETDALLKVQITKLDK